MAERAIERMVFASLRNGLKPCPKCQKQPEIEEEEFYRPFSREDGSGGSLHLLGLCVGCPGHLRFVAECEFPSIEKTYQTVEKVAISLMDLWNRRVAEPKILEEIEANV